MIGINFKNYIIGGSKLEQTQVSAVQYDEIL